MIKAILIFGSEATNHYDETGEIPDPEAFSDTGCLVHSVDFPSKEAYNYYVNNNGFRVVYATSHDVTATRAAEIRSRRHIYDSIAILKAEAPRHFGNMLHTDIYDFWEFAERYDPDPDILIHNVFVHGREKIDLYVGPNPAFENPAKWISNKTLQGALYISRKDFLRHTTHSQKVYRYWSCRPPHQSSDTDQHYSHFPEEERLY